MVQNRIYTNPGRIDGVRDGVRVIRNGDSETGGYWGRGAGGYGRVRPCTNRKSRTLP